MGLNSNRSYITLGILIVYISSINAGNLKCPLVWVQSSIGEYLPETVMGTSVFDTQQYIARAIMSDGKYSVGYMEEGSVHIPYKNNQIVLNSYEILTNPNGCLIKWVESISPIEFAMSVDSERPTIFIGRVQERNRLYTGEIVESVIKLIDASGTFVIRNSNFEYLLSYSKGLVLEVTDFILDNNAFSPTKDFIGIDEVFNRADATVKQTVTFSKKVFQSTTITNNDYWAESWKVDFYIQPDIVNPATLVTITMPRLSLGFESSEYYSKDTSFEKSTTNIVEVEREVIVPPNTEVQICSTLNMLNNFKITYRAKGRYTAAGLDADEVDAILQQQSKFGVKQGNAVIVEESGSFEGTLAMNSQFFVVPRDNPGCSELSKAIVKFNKSKESGNYTFIELNLINQEIDDVISKMSKSNVIV